MPPSSVQGEFMDCRAGARLLSREYRVPRSSCPPDPHKRSSLPRSGNNQAHVFRWAATLPLTFCTRLGKHAHTCYTLCENSEEPFSCQHHLANLPIEHHSSPQNTCRASSSASPITQRTPATLSPGSKPLENATSLPS